jgi:hypothetical protein
MRRKMQCDRRFSSKAEEPDQSVAPDLDRLSDQEIDSLYHGTLRRVAHEARRSPGTPTA